MADFTLMSLNGEGQKLKKLLLKASEIIGKAIFKHTFWLEEVPLSAI